MVTRIIMSYENDILITECKNTRNVYTKLKKLFVGTIERKMLAVKMDEHFGYEKIF